MKITQITFVPKNPKCLTVKTKRYLIATTDTFEALDKATELLKYEKHFERYKALPAIIINVHDI